MYFKLLFINIKNILKMKSNLFKFAIAILSLSVVSCSNSKSSKNLASSKNPNEFTIKGTITGIDSTKYLGLYYRDSTGIGQRDTIFVENGSFSYKGEIPNSQLVFFWVMNLDRLRALGSSKALRFQTLVNPGDNITFSGEVSSFVDAYPSGTKANDDLAKIHKKIYPLLVKSARLNNKYRSLKRKSSKDKTAKTIAELKAISDSVKVFDAQVLNFKKEFVKKNPQSQAAAWYLSDMLVRSQVNDEEAVEIFNNFDAAVLKGNTFYDEVSARVKAIENIVIGKEIENFNSINVLDNSAFSLNALKGKYVLIDFWGLWCGPCRQEMPKVKEYADKYKEKLVVVGVNNGDEKNKIVEFAKKKGFDWIQLMDTGSGNNLVVKFNVQGFPTKLILDPQGKLVYRSSGSGEESFEKLDEFLK